MAYKMTHPDTKTEIKVEADMVRMYESQGWETAPTAPPVDKSDEDKGK